MDKVGIRRLIAYIKKRIHVVYESMMYEIPDSQTRSRITQIISDQLSDLKSRNALYQYQVICDETNNSPLNIDNNEINVTISLQPRKTINYVTMDMSLSRNVSLLSILVDLEAKKYGFVPSPKPTGNKSKFSVHGIVGLQSGFVCDSSTPDCEPFFVIGTWSRSYMLYDGSYKYFLVGGSEENLDESVNYTTKDMEIIARATEEYVK
jgi:hypothetical protein